MSVHLIECAAEVQLPPALKLALLCFADSGSQEGRIAKPGLDNLMRWTGLKKSRALEVVKHLQELQLLASHRAAHRGQRAEYVVFPNGCCERHGKASATVLSVVDDGSEKGSGPADPLFSTGSGTSDPVTANGSDPAGGMGPIPDPERVRSPRSKVEPSKYLTPTDSTPGGTGQDQPAARATAQVVSIDLVSDAREPVGRLRQPSGEVLGCRNCDVGWVCDRDGMPVSKCPHCHPAFRQRTDSA